MDIKRIYCGLQPAKMRAALFSAAALLRLSLLLYGEWQDRHSKEVWVTSSKRTYTYT